MLDTDKHKFLGKLTMVSEYYGSPLSKATVGMWWHAMEAFELADFARAMDAHVRDPEAGRFMPKIADVVRRLEGSSSERALAAWVQVRDAVRAHGHGTSVQFADTVAAQVIADMGGWEQLCSMKTEDVPFRERDFCKRYAAYIARGAAVQHDGLFIGAYDQQNMLNGFCEFVKEPVAIGNVRKLLSITDQRGMPTAKAIGKLVQRQLEGRGAALEVPKASG